MAVQALELQELEEAKEVARPSARAPRLATAELPQVPSGGGGTSGWPLRSTTGHRSLGMASRLHVSHATMTRAVPSRVKVPVRCTNCSHS